MHQRENSDFVKEAGMLLKNQFGTVILDEAHITNVAVLPEYRKQGIGEKMMREILRIAKEHGAVAMTLEVRPSNAPALALYHKFGFVSEGIRKQYYEDNGEDAIIMWLRNIDTFV